MKTKVRGMELQIKHLQVPCYYRVYKRAVQYQQSTKVYYLTLFFHVLFNFGVLKKMQRKVRVATYNVLSSSLCSPSYFSNVSDEKWCSSKYRLEGLMKKLRTEIDNNAIICLQEVSLAWTGKLHTFLESNDYAFVVSNYGHRFNG